MSIKELIPPPPEAIRVETRKVNGFDQWGSTAHWTRHDGTPDSAEWVNGRTCTSDKRAETSAENYLEQYRKADLEARRRMLGWRPLTAGEKMLLT